MTRLISGGLVLISGRETNPHTDSEVDIRSLDSGAVLSVEYEEDGDLACVIEKSDPSVRYRVPRVFEEDS